MVIVVFVVPILGVGAGVITTVAGSGSRTPAADGVGTAATLDPQGICVDSAGDLFVADSSGFSIRRITSAGMHTSGCALSLKHNSIRSHSVAHHRTVV